MKKSISSGVIAIIIFAGLLVTSCGSNDAANAENKDTVSTYIEPQPDNATVRPDTMQTQVPADSGLDKEKMKP